MMESSIVGGDQGDVVQAGDLVEAQDQVVHQPFLSMSKISQRIWKGFQLSFRELAGCEAEVLAVDEARANCDSPHRPQGDLSPHNVKNITY